MFKGYMSKCSSCGAACHSDAGWCPSCNMPRPVRDALDGCLELGARIVGLVGLIFLAILAYRFILE